MISEKYLSVKELTSAIEERTGLKVSERFVRDMLAAGVPRLGFSARLSVVLDWWEKHPNFSPRSKQNVCKVG